MSYDNKISKIASVCFLKELNEWHIAIIEVVAGIHDGQGIVDFFSDNKQRSRAGAVRFVAFVEGVGKATETLEGLATIEIIGVKRSHDFKGLIVAIKYVDHDMVL